MTPESSSSLGLCTSIEFAHGGTRLIRISGTLFFSLLRISFCFHPLFSPWLAGQLLAFRHRNRLHGSSGDQRIGGNSWGAIQWGAIRKEQNVLESRKRSLRSSTLSFSPMRRSWIPKSRKGAFRPITQPDEKDRIVMEGLHRLLITLFDSSFLRQSHGFRPKRGMLTFFADLSRCEGVERLVKADIVKCFDKIDHDLLLSFLHRKLILRLFKTSNSFHLVWIVHPLGMRKSYA